MNLYVTIGVQAKFIQLLEDSFLDYDVEVFNIDSNDLESCLFSLREPGSLLDVVEAKGRAIYSRDVIGSFSEGYLPPEGVTHDGETDDDLGTAVQSFMRAEVLAAAVYLRSSWPAPLNPPGNGAIGPFLDSLPVQWQIIRNECAGVLTPAWSLAKPSDNICGYLYITNPYCYLYNQATKKTSDPDRPRHLAIKVPDQSSAAHFLVFFVRDNVFSVVDTGSGWSPLGLLPKLKHDVRKCIGAIRSHFQVDIGQVEFFYDGRLHYWGASPASSPWMLCEHQFSQYKLALIDLLNL